MDSGDRMFCHACGGVWSKDNAENDLACPHCQSEFTEIVEIPPESPPTHDFEAQSPRINPWADHNPWSREDSPPRSRFGVGESGSPRYTQRTHRSPDGRFTFSSTTISGGSSPREGTAHPNPMVPMMLQSLDSIFQGLQEIHDPQGPRAAGMDPFHPHSPGWPEHDHRGEDQSAGHERLYPRNAETPQPMNPPVSSLADLLELFRTDYGTPQRPRRHGAHGVAAPNPFAMLSALLSMDRSGDAVYSQEELDRVISQLIDQNNNGSGPSPAPPTAIQSLPKKKIDREMLGPDGKAECSICMDAVELGTEVTVLPCKHWFHFSCVEAWLGQNNSCPHCRRSINASEVTGDGTSDNPVVIPDSPEAASSGRRRRRSSPLTSLSRSGRSSFSRSSHNSPSPDVGESGRRPSRSEGHRGGLTGWVWNRFGGGTSS